MKVIIAGSRSIEEDWILVDHCVRLSGYEITEVVSGGARGIDTSGEQFAIIRGIPFKRFPADWNSKGKSAGILRNIEMANYADALIAIWDGKSKGTLHMINDMVSKQKPVYVNCPPCEP